MASSSGPADPPGDRRPRYRWLTTHLGVDPRALAALRIALGLLLLADLGWRATDLTAHYTDAGVLPTGALAEAYPTFAAASLHALSGAWWAVAGLFLLAAAVALALLVGYRTRFATVASLVLLISLQLRNPLVLNAGDSLLVRLLVWGAFLPLGARWSLDAHDRGGEGGPVVRLATAALLAQVVVVYTTNAAFKLQGAQWRSGAAIRTAFGLDQLTIGLGDLLAGYPSILVALDRLWLAMLLGSVLLVLLSGRARTGLVLAFVGAHLGMAATLRLGLFPFVSIAALLPFLPPAAWDRIEAALPGRSAGWMDRLAGRLPSGTLIPTGWWPTGAAPGLVAVLLAGMLLWNAATLGLVGLPAGVTGTVDPDEYRWDMFAPEPRDDDGWYVVPGKTETGATVAAFRGGPISFERPAELASTYPSHRWFVYLLDLRAAENAPLRNDFGAYVCRQWNAEHAIPLESLEVVYVEERVRLGGPEPRRRVLVAEHRCGQA